MQFSSLQEFFSMGGYGLFVWLGYGFTFLMVGGLIVVSLLKRGALLKEVRRAEARKQRIAAADKAKQAAAKPVPQGNTVVPNQATEGMQ